MRESGTRSIGDGFGVMKTGEVLLMGEQRDGVRSQRSTRGGSQDAETYPPITGELNNNAVLCGKKEGAEYRLGINMEVVLYKIHF